MLKKYASFYYMPNKKTRIKRYTIKDTQYDHQKENNYKGMFSKLFILSVN